MKILLIIIFIYLSILFYFDIKTLIEMIKYAYKEGKERKLSIVVVICACILSKAFMKTLIYITMNLAALSFILNIILK